MPHNLTNLELRVKLQETREAVAREIRRLHAERPDGSPSSVLQYLRAIQPSLMRDWEQAEADCNATRFGLAKRR